MLVEQLVLETAFWSFVVFCDYNYETIFSLEPKPNACCENQLSAIGVAMVTLCNGVRTVFCAEGYNFWSQMRDSAIHFDGLVSISYRKNRPASCLKTSIFG